MPYFPEDSEILLPPAVLPLGLLLWYCPEPDVSGSWAAAVWMVPFVRLALVKAA